MKAIGASFSQLITSVMVSRLVLNLRSLSSPELRMSISDGDRDGAFKALALRTIGNLGEDFDTEDSAPETRSMQLRKMSVRGRGRLV